MENIASSSARRSPQAADIPPAAVPDTAPTPPASVPLAPAPADALSAAVPPVPAPAPTDVLAPAPGAATEPVSPAALRFAELEAIVARLRAPGGCPWDAEQTHASIAHNLVEEAYEALDAIEQGDNESLCEELGDVLLQVVFHAQIANENNNFSLAELVAGINNKLIRRHPHVF
ncbi:MAG: hypothetical protein LBP28_09205, partial [Coriobacteriales bacterium]|nr:hypothetical protein [Coriobacteriales bacterium]